MMTRDRLELLLADALKQCDSCCLDDADDFTNVLHTLLVELQGKCAISFLDAPNEGEFVVYDIVDRDYHAGGGVWSDTPEVYSSYAAAQRALDDVDCDATMRDRLVIVEWKS